MGFFDVKAYLDEKNIPYVMEGRNISHGWVGTFCPFCGDNSTHFGINLNSASFSCWVCGKKGWAYEMIMAFESVSFQKAKSIAQGFFVGTRPRQERRPELREEMEIPVGFKTEFPKAYLNYLKSRRYDETVIQRYGLLAAPFTGPYRYRIIIPVYEGGLLKTFVGRDITEEQEERYKNCSNVMAAKPTRMCVYNIDTAMRDCIIVEGPLDVWRMGASVFSTLGTEFTNAQVNLIRAAGVETATVIADGEKKAQEKAVKLARNFSLLGLDAGVMELPLGMDPDDLTEEEVLEIRNIVFGG